MQEFEKLLQEVRRFLDTIPAMPQVEFVAGQYTWTAEQYLALVRLNNYVHAPLGSETKLEKPD